ncbi:MAG: hypothetical protein E6230_15700 [Paenibacillus dendritiformis]|nr:hypothetical protein [Paenibacillus dendritiformis]
MNRGSCPLGRVPAWLCQPQRCGPAPPGCVSPSAAAQPAWRERPLRVASRYGRAERAARTAAFSLGGCNVYPPLAAGAGTSGSAGK